MTIELLWLIPIIAFSLFLPVIVISYQNSKTNRKIDIHTRDLAKQVQQFNAGAPIDPSDVHAGEKRLLEIEKTISLVTSALSTQQKTIETVMGKDDSHSHQLTELKEKLIELQREYDMVMSENYSLRARVKKLARTDEEKPGEQNPSFHVVPGNASKKKLSTMALYDDTRIMRASDLDDTAEYHISDLQ
ncbi:MAG: hypothetical protein ACOCW2_02230 [Chitinivibrionales bacterium]